MKAIRAPAASSTRGRRASALSSRRATDRDASERRDGDDLVADRHVVSRPRRPRRSARAPRDRAPAPRRRHPPAGRQSATSTSRKLSPREGDLDHHLARAGPAPRPPCSSTARRASPAARSPARRASLPPARGRRPSPGSRRSPAPAEPRAAPRRGAPPPLAIGRRHSSEEPVDLARRHARAQVDALRPELRVLADDRPPEAEERRLRHRHRVPSPIAWTPG